MTAKSTFKQADVTRAIAGVKAAGLGVAAVRVGPRGEIEIITGQPQDNDMDDWRDGSPLYGKAA